MTRMTAAVLFAAVTLAPAFAAAQNIDWTRDPVLQLKESLPAAPARTAAKAPSAPAADAQELLYADGLGWAAIAVPNCEDPSGGAVRLTLEQGGVGALFRSSDGQTLRFVFSDLAIANGKILYGKAVIGRVSGNPALPSLDAGYSLRFRYAGVSDACTGADRATVDVFIELPRK